MQKRAKTRESVRTLTQRLRLRRHADTDTGVHVHIRCTHSNPPKD